METPDCQMSGEYPPMITVLLFTHDEADVPEHANFMVEDRDARLVVRSPVPSFPIEADRLNADAIVVWSSDVGRDGLALLGNLRNTGDEMPFIIAAKNPDRGVAFEAIMRNAGYYVLPDKTPEDSFRGLSKLIGEAIEKQALRQTLEKLNKKLSLVGSVTRHDVMNQLTAIMGFNELLSMLVQDPKMTGYLEKERSAIEKIQHQFQYAKDYQNIGVESPGWRVIKEVVDRMSDELDLSTVKIIVTTGRESVFADPLFEKVIYNLFDNALRHGGDVSMIRVSSEERNGGIVLVIEDNGTGIPASIKEKIFERGYGKNTGWGLFLVREILLITGMTIAECSEAGKGARFEISIPRGSYALYECPKTTTE